MTAGGKFAVVGDDLGDFERVRALWALAWCSSRDCHFRWWVTTNICVRTCAGRPLRDVLLALIEWAIGTSLFG
jgi:hypothetical protein